MASLEAKLAEAINEARHLSEALEKEVEERRRDHDEIIRLEGSMKTAFNRLKEIEDWQKEHDSEKKAAVKEGSSRRFQVGLMIAGAVFGAIITAVIGGWIALKLFGKVP